MSECPCFNLYRARIRLCSRRVSSRKGYRHCGADPPDAADDELPARSRGNRLGSGRLGRRCVAQRWLSVALKAAIDLAGNQTRSQAACTIGVVMTNHAFILCALHSYVSTAFGFALTATTRHVLDTLIAPAAVGTLI